jgi:hypothetical protein
MRNQQLHLQTISDAEKSSGATSRAKETVMYFPFAKHLPLNTRLYYELKYFFVFGSTISSVGLSMLYKYLQ